MSHDVTSGASSCEMDGHPLGDAAECWHRPNLAQQTEQEEPPPRPTGNGLADTHVFSWEARMERNNDTSQVTGLISTSTRTCCYTFNCPRSSLCPSHDVWRSQSGGRGGTASRLSCGDLAGDERRNAADFSSQRENVLLRLRPFVSSPPPPFLSILPSLQEQ